MSQPTYKLSCTNCGKSYQSNKAVGARINSILKTNPDYLKNYRCRTCAKGVATISLANGTVSMKPMPRVLKTAAAVREEERGEILKEALKHEPKPEPKVEEVMPKVDLSYTPKEYDGDMKEFIPTNQPCVYVNRFFAKGKVKDHDVMMYHFKTPDRDMKNVLLIGDTSTGKSLCIHDFCMKNKIPYHRVVMNGGTAVEDIVGQQVMDEEGKLRFHYQVLIKFMQKGGVFVFDEINAGQKDILHVLNSITDFERKAIVTQNKGEIIQAVDGFMVVACMNPPQEYDLQEMSKSLKSRFCTYTFDFDEKIDLAVVKDAKLVKLASAIRLARVNGQIETPLGTRDLVQYVKIKDAFGYEMAKEMLLSKFNSNEKNAIKTMIETHLEKPTGG